MKRTIWALIIVLACLFALPALADTSKMTLDQVRHWAYNIQHINTDRQRAQLTSSHFDLYVLEPVVTEKHEEGFDIAGLVAAIRSHNIETRGVDPLIIAYLDIGQAEEWRWYYDPAWKVGDPDWIVAADPDGWDGNYPVAFWREIWQQIVITGYQGRSMIEEALKAGFDGIYLDWIEAFSDDRVVAQAAREGVDPASAMLEFIERMRRYARIDSPNANPNFLIVAQNAPDLYDYDQAWYSRIVDAIAVEGIWYDGDGGFDEWDDPAGYNMQTNDIYPGYTEELLGYLDRIKEHMPVFNVEYAQDLNGQNLASRVYRDLAPAHGFIPYCTRRSLAQLSTTPYPAGYTPIDY